MASPACGVLEYQKVDPTVVCYDRLPLEYAFMKSRVSHVNVQPCITFWGVDHSAYNVFQYYTIS